MRRTQKESEKSALQKDKAALIRRLVTTSRPATADNKTKHLVIQDEAAIPFMVRLPDQ